jgi:predicted ATP-dependent protease
MVKIIPVSTLKDVLDNILVAGPRKEGLLERLAKFFQVLIFLEK